MCRPAPGRRFRGCARALTVLWGVLPATVRAQLPMGMERFGSGRFTVAAATHDAVLAQSILRSATARDSFPWLPRPTERVLILIAPDRRAFEALRGPNAPEYGAAVAIPSERRIVMQGSRAGSDAGDPLQVLRHELAHLALHEYLGDLPPRWFDEGYASFVAGEWGREELLATSLSLVWHRVPTLDELEGSFGSGQGRAAAAYALAHRAVVELAALDRERGLTLLFRYWKSSGSLDAAIREAFLVTEGDFEAQWRQRTRRRYGALAVFADLTAAVTLFFLFLLPLYVARRRRNRRRLATMAMAEMASEQRERENAIEALLRSVAPPANPHDGAATGN